MRDILMEKALTRRRLVEELEAIERECGGYLADRKPIIAISEDGRRRLQNLRLACEMRPFDIDTQ